MSIECYLLSICCVKAPYSIAFLVEKIKFFTPDKIRALDENRSFLYASQTMNLSILLVSWLTLTTAALAEPATVPPTELADWHRSGIDNRTKLSLSARGWRLDDDGRAFDPQTKSPATQERFDKALFDLRQRASQSALEKVRLMLSSGKPLKKEDLEIVARLSRDLPADFLAGALNAASPSKLRALTDANLSRIASYFDGSRVGSGQPDVVPGEAAPVNYPEIPHFDYLTIKKISRDPYGRKVLERLKGKDGNPELPPVLIENLNGPAAAYDFRRRAVVLDRETMITSLTSYHTPKEAAELRKNLASHDALMAYLKEHPGAVGQFVERNDVVLVHELAHAWQDRRDPVMQAMIQGYVPVAQILEYEKEAFLTKNLYLHSKLKNNPASVVDDEELTDYVAMMTSQRKWWNRKRNDYRAQSPAFALDLSEVAAIQKRRLAEARSKPAATTAQRREKARGLQALAQGREDLSAFDEAQTRRLNDLESAVDRSSPERHKHLGMYYLKAAQDATRDADRLVLLQKAEYAAAASGDAALIENVRKAKETK